MISIKTHVKPNSNDPDVLAEAEKIAKVSWYHPELGCLYKSDGSKSLLFVPKSLQPRILAECHNAIWSGHMSAERTLNRIKENFFWPGMRNDVERYVASCHDCLRSKVPTHPTREEMQPIPATEPWKDIVIDVIGPLTPSKRQNKYILVMIDRFTKWPECKPLRSQTAQKVAEAFIELVVCRHGIPNTIQTDLGSNFCSSLFQEVGKLLGVQHKFSTAYHPQSQGLCERFNRTLLSLLRAYTSSDHSDWDTFLPMLLMSYRTTKHSSSGFTPFELTYGREAALPPHFLLPESQLPPLPENEFCSKLATKMVNIAKVAKDNMTKASEQQKKQKDRRSHPSQVQPGDMVYVHRPHNTPGISPKLSIVWHGPVRVLKRHDPNVEVEWPGRSHKSRWIHLDRTKLSGDTPSLPAPSHDYSPKLPNVKTEREDNPYNLRSRPAAPQ